MKRQEKMDPLQRDAYKILLKELDNLGEEAAPTRQILQLALQLDKKRRILQIHRSIWVRRTYTQIVLKYQKKKD